jgi:hypothetical protein
MLSTQLLNKTVSIGFMMGIKFSCHELVYSCNYVVIVVHNLLDQGAKKKKKKTLTWLY